MTVMKKCPHCGQSTPSGEDKCQWCHKLGNGTEVLRCRCGRELAVAAKFCPVCGSSTENPVCLACGSDVDAEDVFCQACGVGLVQSVAPGDPVDLTVRVQRLELLMGEVADSDQQAWAVLESSNVYHENFWTRAFSIWGHAVAAATVVIVPIYIVLFLLGALAGRA